MSELAFILALVAVFLAIPAALFAWAAVMVWLDGGIDDTPPGDHSHYDDSIRAAQKANGRAPDA
jgi:hypothetical protein